MHKKIKTISKMICTVLLSIVLFSTECFAANDSISPHGLSGFRCLNSTCGGAYLEDDGPGYAHCNKCNNRTWGYRCNVCGRKYNICDQGHYYNL